MNNLIDKLSKHITKNKLLLKDKFYLIAVSGGVDSMVLLHLLHQLSYKIVAAHVNFQLRGEASDLDEKLVIDICNKIKIPIHTTQFNTLNIAKNEKLSIQETARKLRYNWFDELLKKNKLNNLITAHHKNDSVETFFINLLRGSGLKGLTGIHSHEIIRPFLTIEKDEILTYANENLIAYREDSSNAKEDYLRNKIRLKLMPVIDEINNETSSKIAETINRLNDANEIYNDRIQQLIPTFFKPIDNGYAIEIKRLKSLKGSPTLLFEAISKFNFNYDMVLNILNVKESGRYFRSDTHQLLVDRTHYFIHEIKNEIIVDNIEIIENASEINSENFSLIIKKIDPSSKIIIDENIAQFNHDLIAYPLILRQWQAGDYFYPLGLNKKKKVSQLLKNNKINRNDKQKTWVICIDKKIIWVLGMRIDHRFRVDENTKTILNIELINNK